MRNENDLAEAQRLNDGFQIAKLLLEAVGCAGRLVGGAKAEEIERDDASAARRQVGNKIVIDVQVVGETVHQHEGRTRTVVIARIEASLAARNVMLGESRLAVHDVLVEAAF